MIKVEFIRGKFVICCDKFHAGKVAGLPNRRYNKKRCIWTAPPIRLNIINMLQWDDVEFDDQSMEVLNLYKEETNASTEPFPKGYKFKIQPRDYQKEGLDKAWSVPSFALFMDPGTGKTKVSIETATARFQMGQIKKVLVIALVSIKENWRLEIEKHCPIATNIHILNTTVTGRKRYKKWLESSGDFKWLIVGIESFSAGGAIKICQAYADENTMIIVDESSRIKNHKTKRTERAIDLGTVTKYKMILTGTPVTQGMEDLYSQYQFLNKEIIGIGDHYSFRNRYCILGGHEDKQVIGYKNTEELISAVSPYTFQARKRDVLSELPPYTREIRKVKMTKEQIDLYKELKKRLKVEYKDNQLVVKNVMNLMQRFSEITGGHISYEIENPDLLNRDKKPIIYQKMALNRAPKLVETMALIEEFPNDEAVIIWTPDAMEAEMIATRISNKYRIEVGRLTGRVNIHERNRYVKEFQENNLRFIVGNPLVGGIGLNLTASRYTIYYNRDFSLETKIQSEARVDRIGQTRGVTYFDIICEGTIDEYKLKVLNSKKDFAETVRNSIDDGGFLDLI